MIGSTMAPAARAINIETNIEDVKEMEHMARKLRKSTISGLMADWGRKGGSRATEAQKNAARENLKKTPNCQKRTQLAEGQLGRNFKGGN